MAENKTRDVDALRLVLLYYLRYDKHSSNDKQGLKDLLRTRGFSDVRLKLLQCMLNFAEKTSGDSATDLLSADHVKLFTKKVIKGLKGVENIYTQHSPLIKEVVEELVRSKLKPAHYPYLGTVQLNERPREIIVFVIGGATYEESLAIHNLNKSLSNVDIILGSSCVHNTSSFLEEVLSASTAASKTSSLTKAL